MSHAVRHAARRLARSAVQTTRGADPAPGATHQQHHLRRPFSHSAPVRESQQRAPTPSVAPPPTGPGDTKQKAKSAISWPGLAFLAGAAVVGQLYYMGGGSTEDLIRAGGGSDAPARKASSSKPAKKTEPATKTEPAPAPEPARHLAGMPRAWQKLVDCISSVWSQYDELESETLGAVVVVLEGCGLHVVSADWGDGEEPMAYPVTPLDESLAPYFA